MFAGTALSVHLFVCVGLSLFIICGPYLSVVVCVLYAYNLTQHWEDLVNLFQVLIRFGLKISPHKCQLFRDKLVYMGLEFLIKDGTAHYTAMRDKCGTIRNMKAPKSVKECRTFCGMVNFLSTFCKNLRQLLIPIYELTKKTCMLSLD